MSEGEESFQEEAQTASPSRGRPHSGIPLWERGALRAAGVPSRRGGGGFLRHGGAALVANPEGEDAWRVDFQQATTPVVAYLAAVLVAGLTVSAGMLYHGVGDGGRVVVVQHMPWQAHAVAAVHAPTVALVLGTARVSPPRSVATAGLVCVAAASWVLLLWQAVDGLVAREGVAPFAVSVVGWHPLHTNVVTMEVALAVLATLLAASGAWVNL